MKTQNVLIILFCLTVISFPAQIYWGVMDSVLPVTKDVDRNPSRLVERLTEGKHSDKERFDAIFLWVVRNIGYDYYKYSSPSGAAMPRIDRVLKYKTGICLDYSFLMDSLCKLAGLQSIPIFGYAKDDLFDVHDSLFADNHAWNIVKLDNLWYVYDATWTSGSYQLGFTPFSTWIIKLRKKYGRKLIGYREVKGKHRRTTECDTFYYEANAKIPEYKQSFLGRVIVRLSYKFKLKLRRYFSGKPNLNFYLTKPEILAITHFPDNPDWSLVATTSMRQFETDSAYYYRTEKSYINQHREGRYCEECGGYFSMSPMEKELNMIRKSSQLNKRNHIIISLSDGNICDLYYRESIPIEDSLEKVTLIDSAILFAQCAKNELYEFRRGVMDETNMQKSKNQKKDRILYEENREHIEFMRQMIRQTYEEGKKISYFGMQTDNKLRRFRRLRDWNFSDKTNIAVKSKNLKPEDLTAKLRTEQTLMLTQLDSVQQVIEIYREDYRTIITRLAENLWKKNALEDSLCNIFMYGENYRFHMLDNYKKPVVDIRAKIPLLKNDYGSDMRRLIYQPSDSCADFGSEILRIIDDRNKLALIILKLKRQLIREGALEATDREIFLKRMKNLVQQDICWIEGGSSKLMAVMGGYYAMKFNQEGIQWSIRAENKTEYERYKQINKEIVRRKRRYSNIARHNLVVATKRVTFLKRYKKTFLKSLKDARKKNE
jgi:hypothetical protein